MYEEFAAVYDALMDDFDYPAWAAYYLRLLAEAGCAPRTAFECGCGTGSMSIPLAKSGLRLTASDLSDDMLRLAQQKARRNGVMIPFVHMDMRSLAVPRPVDAVLACCDAVNYLTTPEDAAAFFAAAHKALKSGGSLAFDVSSEAKLTAMKDAFYGEERDKIAYLWQNRMDDESRVITMDLTFFVETEGGLYRRFEEQHLQRAHSEDELRRWLAEAGFADIRVYGDRAMRPPAPQEQRLHFTARKP
ncbi:MAG: methyltransferase domain-containing protein [Clostridia bacterium]|nr:methyltransferase domain-containing protein [Clostridia bacterium]